MELKAISRVNEFTDPELLRDDELTELKNMTLEGGIAFKRGGVIGYNVNTAGGSVKELYELEDYRLGLVDVGTTRSLKKSTTNGTWSTLKGGLADVDLFGAIRDDKMYFTNGSDAPFVTDGSTVWDLGLSKPDLSSTTTAEGTGGNLDASDIYRWAIAYITERGEIGDYSIIGHYISGSDNTTDSTNKKVTFTSLPVSTRSDVTGRRIYRTEGDGSTFYHLTDIDNTVTTFTDDYADTKLDTSLTIPFTNVPTKASQICTHKDRLFLSNVTLESRSVVKPPTVPFSITTDDTGDRNTYYYAISYVDSLGRESELSTSTSIQTHNSSGWTNTISGIPQAYTGAYERDRSVVKIKLYRSLNNNTFYHIKDITSTNTNWNSPYLSTTDASLANGTAYSPTSTSYPNRIYYSDIDKFGQINALNYVDVYPQDNEDIIGMVDQEDGVLIFKEKSICFVYTSGSPYNWRVVKLIENIGCSNASSIQRAKNSIYFRYNNDIYRYPDMELVSQEFQDTLSGITIQDTAYVSKYNWYVIVASNNLYIYDERIKSWYNFTTTSLSMTSAMETIDKDFLIGLSGGYLCKYSPSGNYDFTINEASDTTAITCYLKSKHYITGTPTQKFRLRHIFSNFNKGNSPVTQKLINPEDSSSRSKAFSGSGWKTPKEITDSWTGSLKEAHKLRYEIYGDLEEFNGMKVEGRLRRRNRVWS